MHGGMSMSVSMFSCLYPSVHLYVITFICLSLHFYICEYIYTSILCAIFSLLPYQITQRLLTGYHGILVLKPLLQAGYCTCLYVQACHIMCLSIVPTRWCLWQAKEGSNAPPGEITCPSIRGILS